MRARFPRISNIPLALALIVGAIVSVAAFAGLHRAATTGGVEGYPVGGIIAAQNMEVGRVTDSASAVAPNALRLAAAQPSAAHLLPPPPRGSRGPAQLIRTANVTLEVKDVTRALRDATLITDEQLGDVIGMNDETPTSDTDPHTATMAIRVPQYRFERTLEALGHLGKVKSKSVNAQDVSDQLVDSQARLRNLRRTESDMLSIMDRSGNIDQVLNVTQQISSVREQIERLDAQIQGMQYQVAYSTINVSLSSPVVVVTPTGFGVLATAWRNALGSLRDLTIGLLSMLLWLVAFSPYILAVILLGAFVFHRVRVHAEAGTKVGSA